MYEVGNPRRSDVMFPKMEIKLLSPLTTIVVPNLS